MAMKQTVRSLVILFEPHVGATRNGIEGLPEENFIIMTMTRAS